MIFYDGVMGDLRHVPLASLVHVAAFETRVRMFGAGNLKSLRVRVLTL